MTRAQSRRQGCRELSVRFTEAEYDRITKRAEETGRSKSDIIRRAALRGWREQPPSTEPAE